MDGIRSMLLIVLIHQPPLRLEPIAFVLSIGLLIRFYQTNTHAVSLLATLLSTGFAVQTRGKRGESLTAALRSALERDELHVAFQPIFNVNGRITAVEALARWTHISRGEISPAEFIPVAEAAGLIAPLSTFVLRRACQQMASWIGLGYEIQRMAVNISVLQAHSSDFVETVIQILQETGLEPKCLELEITEGALTDDFYAVLRHIKALRRLGVRIAIDDFGTGYSTLARLLELEVDVLKIDRVFVSGADTDERNEAILRSVIGMAHTIGMSVVAEGVEKEEELRLLHSLRCDEIQGFLLGRPVSAVIISPLLLQQSRHTSTSQNLCCLQSA